MRFPQPPSGPSRKPYRFAKHASLGSQMRGMYTIRSGANATVILPQFSGKHPLTMRILPARDPDNTTSFLSYRYSPNNQDFTDWIRQAKVAGYVGQEGKRITFILYDERQVEDGYSPDQNPYMALYYAFTSAMRQGSAFIGRQNVMKSSWTRLQAERSISKPRDMFWVQALIYANGDTVYVEKGSPPRGASSQDPVCIVQFPSSAGKMLTQMLDETAEGSRLTEDEDWNKIFKYGDITDLKEGKFVTLYNPDVHNIGMYTDPKSVMGSPENSMVIEEGTESHFRRVRSSDDDFKRYEVAIHDRYYYMSQGRIKYRRADISEYPMRVLDWDSTLHYPSDEEIAVWLVRAFSDFPELFLFAWKDMPWFFTDEVKAILHARKTISVDGLLPELQKNVQHAYADVGSDDEAPFAADDQDDLLVPEQQMRRADMPKASALLSGQTLRKPKFSEPEEEIDDMPGQEAEDDSQPGMEERVPVSKDGGLGVVRSPKLKITRRKD